MLRKRLYLSWLTLLISPVVAGTDCRGREAQQVSAARLEAYFTANLTQFGNTEDQVVARLGPPVGLKRRQSPSRHNIGSHLFLSTLTYKVVQVDTVRAPKAGSAEVYILTYRGGTFSDPLIVIGSPKTRVFELLGPPVGGTSLSILRYETGNRDLLFTFAEGKVVQIEFRSYIE